jgi:hypothetical protein
MTQFRDANFFNWIWNQEEGGIFSLSQERESFCLKATNVIHGEVRPRSFTADAPAVGYTETLLQHMSKEK